MFKTVVLSPIASDPLEAELYSAIQGLIKCAAKLRIKDRLYVEPSDAEELDNIITSQKLQQLDAVLKNHLDIEFENDPISVLQKKQEGTAAPSPVHDNSAGKADETVSHNDIGVDIKPEESCETRVMRILQETSLNARAEPPKDFFMVYTRSRTCLPMFVLFITVALIVQIGTSIFH